MLKHIKRYGIYMGLSTKKPFSGSRHQNDKQEILKKPAKLIKIARKNTLNQELKNTKPEFENKEDYLSKTETNYYNNIKEKVNENLGTRRFYNYEIERGEDLIDNIPVDPYYEYRIIDLEAEVQEKKKQLTGENGVKAFEDSHRLEKLKNAISTFQTMKHRYEYEEYLKKLKEYPGSPKGPNPEHDPEAFQRYSKDILPQWVPGYLSLQSQFTHQHKEEKDLLEDLNDDNEDKKSIDVKSAYNEQYTKPFGQSNITDFLSRDPKPPNPPESGSFLLDELLQEDDGDINIVPYSQVPLLPNTPFEEYQQFIEKMELWTKFAKFYSGVNKDKIYDKMKQRMDGHSRALAMKHKIETGESLQDQNVTIKPSIYSLYTYYKTLPKHIQEHPGVRTTYLGLEYSQPDVSYEKKEEILNKAAAMCLPLDKFSIAAMQKLLEKRADYPTPHQVDRVLNMNPQFTWDIRQFMEQLKNEKLRSISTVKEKQEKYNQPPETQKIWNEGMANLPVDFYDNDDGFWDEHINRKLTRYENVKPMGKKTKTDFIH